MNSVIKLLWHKGRLKSIQKHWLFLLTAVILILISLTNAIHDKYPDEFDNLLGGRYLLEGKIIYRDFFTHHGPVPYFIAAFVLFFSQISFVWFRLLFAILTLICMFFGYRYFQQKHPKAGSIYGIYIILFTVAATYFWGHMLLSDNIAALSILPVYLLILITLLFNSSIRFRDIAVASAMLAVATLSSLTYAYAAMILYAAVFFLFAQNHRRPKSILTAIGLFALPYLIWLVYLLLTGSLLDFYHQTIDFNSKYYIYNYPRSEDSTFINPMRLAVVVVHSFIQNIHPLLTNIKNVDLFYPINTTMVVGNLAFLYLICLRGKWPWAIFFFLLFAFVNARSNPFESGERDYQSAVYIHLSMLNTILALYLFTQEQREKLNSSLHTITQSLFLVLSVLTLFSTVFLVRQLSDKVFVKYMGTAPLIYDRPSLAPIINAVVAENDYMWIGPFDFEDLFYANGRVPSKYHILIPAMSRNGMSAQLQADIQATQPKIIIFDWHLFILGTAPLDYAPDFVEYLNTNYLRLKDYTEDGYKYMSVEPVTLRRNVEEKMYIHPDRKDEVITDLLNANIIKRIPAN